MLCGFVQLLTVALSSAHEDDITFREGLPLSYLSYTGMVNLGSVSWRGSHGFGMLRGTGSVSELKRIVLPLWTCLHTRAHTHHTHSTHTQHSHTTHTQCIGFETPFYILRLIPVEGNL